MSKYTITVEVPPLIKSDRYENVYYCPDTCAFHQPMAYADGDYECSLEYGDYGEAAHFVQG